jgi:phosphohistidine phosphatase SixA
MPTLYLCRHAIAADPSAGMNDAHRPLTSDGVKKFRKAARGFIKLIGAKNITHLLASPLLRARQTAEILSEALAQEKYDIPVKLTDALEPPGDLKQLQTQLRALKSPAGIIAVGHEPFLGHWIGELCFAHAGRVQVKKGAIAAIELAHDHAHGELLFLLQPGILRDL